VEKKMNIERNDRARIIHAIHKSLRYSVCGLLWIEGKNTKETMDEVTCRHCLRKLR